MIERKGDIPDPDWGQLVEPTDGLDRRDRHGVAWAPFDGVWWCHVEMTGEDAGLEVDHMQWRELAQRGPFKVLQ